MLLKNIRIRTNYSGWLCLFEINADFALVLLKPGKERNDVLSCILGGPDLNRIRTDSSTNFVIVLAFKIDLVSLVQICNAVLKGISNNFFLCHVNIWVYFRCHVQNQYIFHP